MTGLLSIVMVIVLCASFLSACSDASTSNGRESQNSSDTRDNTDDSTSNTDTSEDDSSSDDSQLSNDVVGKVMSIASTYIRIDIYEPDTKIADYATLDGIILTDALTTDTVMLETDAAFKYASSGILYTTTQDELAVGDMIAVTTDEDGLQQIIILEYGEDDTDTDDDSSTDDTGSDVSTDTSEDGISSES